MTISTQPGIIPQFTVADRLRKAREVTGLDQTAFAEHAGLSRAGVSKAERGESTPRRSTLRLWALASGVPLSWLETGETPSPSGDGASADASPLSESNRRPFHYRSDSHGPAADVTAA